MNKFLLCLIVCFFQGCSDSGSTDSGQNPAPIGGSQNLRGDDECLAGSSFYDSLCWERFTLSIGDENVTVTLHRPGEDREIVNFLSGALPDTERLFDCQIENDYTRCGSKKEAPNTSYYLVQGLMFTSDETRRIGTMGIEFMSNQSTMESFNGRVVFPNGASLETPFTFRQVSDLILFERGDIVESGGFKFAFSGPDWSEDSQVGNVFITTREQ